MKTHLIDHLRISGDTPNDEGLTYLELAGCAHITRP